MVRQGDGGTSEVPVENLKLGDILVVKPDERVAADGFIVKGISAINQAPVPGDSMPVDKRPVQVDAAERKSVGQGKSVSVRVNHGGRRLRKKKNNQTSKYNQSTL